MKVSNLVSVCTITYNQEKYIEKAIESILLQEADFDFELVIGEDCSIDKTREICISYKNKYPEKLKLIQNETNIGASKNIINVISNCTGKYIAICEGDDYWTDPYKLQKQVDYLEANPEYSATCHQTEIIYEKNPEKKELYFQSNKRFLTKKDIIQSTSIHINSIVFRKEALMKYDIKNAKHLVDHALFILIAQSGKFKVFPEVMSVYRKHANGIAGTSIPGKAYFGQIGWIKEIREILGWRFFWGYHYLSSKIHCYYMLNYPELNTGCKIKLIRQFIKHALLVMLLYPRSIKLVFRLSPKLMKRLTA